VKKLIRNRKGQGLVEYALIIAGVALIAAVGMSIFGHKVSDMINAVAVVLPGSHPDENGAIVSGQVIETTPSGGTGITTNYDLIAEHENTARLMANVWGEGSPAATSPEVWIPQTSASPIP